MRHDIGCNLTLQRPLMNGPSKRAIGAFPSIFGGSPHNKDSDTLGSNIGVHLFWKLPGPYTLNPKSQLLTIIPYLQESDRDGLCNKRM